MVLLQIRQDVDAYLAGTQTGTVDSVQPGSDGSVTGSAAAAASQVEIKALSQELDRVTCISATLRQLMDASHSSLPVLQAQGDALIEQHAAALAELKAFRQEKVESEAAAASAALAIHAQCVVLIQELSNVRAEAGRLHETTSRIAVEVTSLQAVAAAAAAAATASQIGRNELVYELAARCAKTWDLREQVGSTADVARGLRQQAAAVGADSQAAMVPFNYCNRCRLYAQRCCCWY
jgi:chromosome segregation ATPase